MVLEVNKRHMGLLKDILYEWHAQNRVSKFIIIASLVLVIFAYLPTLQFDYVTQDQWRAFRYPVNFQLYTERFRACSEGVFDFYTLTGRPLVWVPECIEHTFVESISDFKYFRPVALFIVLSTVIFLGFSLSNMVGFAAGVVTASVFVMAPGYSFMYLQSMPALMVLLSIIFSSISYILLRNNLKKDSVKTLRLLLPLVLFILACLSYPIYAFVVIPLILVDFGFDINTHLKDRLRILFISISFYLFCSIVYYVIVKLLQATINITKSLGDGSYEFAVELNFETLVSRIMELIDYFSIMPVTNYSLFLGFSLCFLLLFSVVPTWINSKDKKNRLQVFFGQSLLYFVLAVILLLASVSPWLFSKMPSISTRHLVSWYLFFSITSVGVVYIIAKSYLRQHFHRVLPFILIVILMPVSFVQHRLSILEVLTSGVEIQTMRSRLNIWINNNGWENQRFLLIIHPLANRLAGTDYLISDYNDNAVLSLSKNKVSVPWFVRALINETSLKNKFEIISCGLNYQSCVEVNLLDENKIVVSYANGHETITSSQKPFVINFSKITHNPVDPLILVKSPPPVPIVKATSRHILYGPEGLFYSKNPGWHASSPSVYPQKLTIDLRDIKQLNSLSFLPQDGNYQRMPNNMIINISKDGNTWEKVALFENVCKSTPIYEWHKVPLLESVDSQYVQIEILNNCGDPDLLTLKGLKIE